MKMNVLYKDNNQTAASKLLLQLENNHNIVYAYVTADVGNEKLISIRQRKKGRKAVTLGINDNVLGQDENMDTFAKRGKYSRYTFTYTCTFPYTCTLMSTCTST